MKKLFSLLALVAAFTFAANTLSAQITFGVRGGVNAANISQNFEDSDFETETVNRIGFQIGGVLEYEFSDKLALQSGLIFNSKGFALDIEDEDNYGSGADGYDRTTINYLEIPISAAYKINDLQIFAGPYVAFGIGGKNDFDVDLDGNNISGDTDLIPFFGEVGEGDLEEDESAYRGLDVGLNFGVGYVVGPVLVNLGYSLGLGNLTPEVEGAESDPSDFSRSNRVLSLTASYFFGK